MDDPIDSLTDLLLTSILPNLRAVQVSQSEQIAANDRLEQAIEHLRAHLNSEFAKLSAQIIAARAEMAALHAALQSLQALTHGTVSSEESKRIH
jgi:cell division protein FtsB